MRPSGRSILTPLCYYASDETFQADFEYGVKAVSESDTKEADGNIDLSEKGRGPEGKPVSLDRRLFMQFMAFRNANLEFLTGEFERVSAQAVIYQDLNDAKGIGVMVYCEDPGYIVDQIHPILNHERLGEMEYREEFTMIGRTYSIGYEADLEDVLICLLYTSPSPRDRTRSRMPSSA